MYIINHGEFWRDLLYNLFLPKKMFVKSHFFWTLYYREALAGHYEELFFFLANKQFKKYIFRPEE